VSVHTHVRGAPISASTDLASLKSIIAADAGASNEALLAWLDANAALTQDRPRGLAHKFTYQLESYVDGHLGPEPFTEALVDAIRIAWEQRRLAELRVDAMCAKAHELVVALAAQVLAVMKGEGFDDFLVRAVAALRTALQGDVTGCPCGAIANAPSADHAPTCQFDIFRLREQLDAATLRATVRTGPE